MKNPWVIIGIITLVLFGGAIGLSSINSVDNNAGIEILQHITGNKDASVKLVEYSDFQCPSCGAFHPLVKTILEKYGDKISFEYKNFPLSTIHQNALSAATAAEAAGQQDKFFEFHDILFERQKDWSNLQNPSAKYMEYAKELNLDLDLFKKHMKSSALRDKIKKEFDDGRALNIGGTPTFFLNGEQMKFGTFQDFLDQIAVAVDPSFVSTSSPSGIKTEQGTEVKFGI